MSANKSVVAVAIASEPQQWQLPYPLYVHTVGYQSYYELTPFKRVEYLARRRNAAVEKALTIHPEAQHIMMIDSHYIGQEQPIKKLVDDYLKTNNVQASIVGATTWGVVRDRLSTYFRPKIQFYDWWAFPEARFIPWGWDPRRDPLGSVMTPPLQGLYRVCSVGGLYLYPKSVWDKGVRYQTPPDLHGCEHNWLCEHSNLPVYMDFNVKVYRNKNYGLIKSLRVSAGYWRRRVLQ